MILVGAHRRAPYKPWIQKSLWAHGSAPLLSKQSAGLVVSDSAPEVYSAMTSFTGCARTSFTPIDGKSPHEGGEGCALESKGSHGSADRVCSASGE